MNLRQDVFVIRLNETMPLEKGMMKAVRSIEICDQLQLTGRIFSNGPDVLVILEGDGEILAKFIDGVREEADIEQLNLIYDEVITAREFGDFSIWLKFSLTDGRPARTHIITTNTNVKALPKEPSVRLRLTIDSLIADDVFDLLAVSPSI